MMSTTAGIAATTADGKPALVGVGVQGREITLTRGDVLPDPPLFFTVADARALADRLQLCRRAGGIGGLSSGDFTHACLVRTGGEAGPSGPAIPSPTLLIL